MATMLMVNTWKLERQLFYITSSTIVEVQVNLIYDWVFDFKLLISSSINSFALNTL